jgi:transcription antitermination factor NusG
MNTAVSNFSAHSLGCYAVKVRVRSELEIAATLRDKGIETLLPTYVDRRQYSDRVRKVLCAVFPGYAFVRIQRDELYRVAQTKGVNYVVRSGGVMEPLPTSEELTLKTLCTLPDGFEPCENLVLGERVRIENGPFRGQNGTLVRSAGRNRIVISLNSIFSSVSIDLRDTVVRSVEDRRAGHADTFSFPNQSALVGSSNVPAIAVRSAA